MKIALGCDHAGYQLKETVKEHLQSGNYDFFDFGTFGPSPVDYPDIASMVAHSVARKEYTVGIIICGTGVGVSIVANKTAGIRAALCGDTFTARAARQHNDANILTMGSRVTGSGLALDIVDAFLGEEFHGGRHHLRVEKIKLYENMKESQLE